MHNYVKALALHVPPFEQGGGIQLFSLKKVLTSLFPDLKETCELMLYTICFPSS